MTLAQKYFGDQYAGFDILLHRLGLGLNVCIDDHVSVEKHKYEILNEVHASKPVTFEQAAEIITEITDIQYDPKELSEHCEDYYYSLIP